MRLPALGTKKFVTAWTIGRMRRAMFSVVVAINARAKHIFIAPKKAAKNSTIVTQFNLGSFPRIVGRCQHMHRSQRRTVAPSICTYLEAFSWTPFKAPQFLQEWNIS